MAKFYGAIGYAQTVDQGSGIWEETIVEKQYYGDLNRDMRRYQAPDKVNDDLTISGELSILSDIFATENFSTIRYVVYMGVKWKVLSVEVRFPRLVLMLGGVYNV